MTQVDSIAKAVDAAVNTSTGTTQSISDTAKAVGDALHVSDTPIHQVADTLHATAQATTTPADTLSEAADTLDSAFAWFNDSILEGSHWPVTIWGDTLTTPASLYDELHRFGEPISYNIFNDNGVLITLLTCFLAFVGMFAWSREYLLPQLRNFFIPSNNDQNQKSIKTPIETYTPYFMAILLCINNGVLLYAFTEQSYDLTCGLYSPRQILFTCIGSFLGYYLLRWGLYKFVNWVFFENSEKRTWSTGFAFLIMLESILLLPVMLYALNAGWNIQNTIICIIFTYAVTRILLLYHSFRIFFPKIYGILHLFAYLCTLELIPLLCLWKFLTLYSVELIVK